LADMSGTTTATSVGKQVTEKASAPRIRVDTTITMDVAGVEEKDTGAEDVDMEEVEA
jgi:hypothetical protein